LLQSKVTS